MATQEENNKRHREKVRLSKLMHRISDQIAETGKEQAFEDLYSCIVTANQNGWTELVIAYGRLLAAQIANTIRVCSPTQMQKLYTLHEKLLFVLAPYDFDSYLLYTEWRRKPENRFYLPRRRALRPLVQAIQDLADDKLDLLCISLPPGTGKALANDTPILTRNGWKNHGDLKVGDEVIGMDGEFKKVVQVHPKCMLDRLMTFTNGEKIQCHERHEWLFRCHSIKGHPYQLRETQEWEKLKLYTGGEEKKRGHRYQYQLPPRCVIGEEKELFSPYMLGVWLGDGSNMQPRITNHYTDSAVIDKLHDLGFAERHKYTNERQKGTTWYDFDIRSELQKFGMCASRVRTEKHIPEEYLTASINQRLELLAGLLDTDGTLAKTKYIFSTTEERLKDSFVQLLSSFGWRACIKSEEPKVSSSGIKGNKTVYVISFTPDMYIPCAVERKQLREIHKQRAVALISIEKVEPKEGNCITVEGDGMYLAGYSMIPTHNTTTALFALTWFAGRNPDKAMLTASHNSAFIRSAYDECLRMMDENGEYRWHKVFDLPISSTNAKDCLIDIGKEKRFKTFQFTTVGSGNAGLYRAQQLLYCDDLVPGIEVALSKERLDKLYEIYTTDLRQRKLGKAKELHIATRWSVHDVIGRLEREHEGDERARFINIPALNAEGKSNFDYPHNLGYTTEMLIEQREMMGGESDPSWKALYMGEPIEREGLLYHNEDLRRFYELPDREPDAIIAVCDTKDRGTDYCVMPIGYVYGQDHYIGGCVCTDALPEVTEPRLVEELLSRKVQCCRFESNSAGGHIATSVFNQVKAKGGRCDITSKYTTQNKETKIIVNSGWVKQHCLFLDESMYQPSSDYGKMMKFLLSYTTAGKNKHDDVPDAMAMYALYAQTFGQVQVMAISRPF